MRCICTATTVASQRSESRSNEGHDLERERRRHESNHADPHLTEPAASSFACQQTLERLGSPPFKIKDFFNKSFVEYEKKILAIQRGMGIEQ